MSNLRTALGGLTASGPLGTVSEAAPLGMITLRGDLIGAAMAAAVKAAGGSAVPGQRQILGQGDSQVAWMSPDELMVFCPYEAAGDNARAAQEALAGTHGTAVNVSDARVILTLTGNGIRDALSKLTPADMRASVFQPGEMRRTRIAQVPCAIWLTDETTAHLIVFRSVARYAFDVLSLSIETPVDPVPAE